MGIAVALGVGGNGGKKKNRDLVPEQSGNFPARTRCESSEVSAQPLPSQDFHGLTLRTCVRYRDGVGLGENFHLHLTNHRESLARAPFTCWGLRTDPRGGHVGLACPSV